MFDNLRTIHMRDELIKDVYFGAYQHIGFSFMEKIIDERIISINMGALHQMSLGLVPNSWLGNPFGLDSQKSEVLT